jgi:OOP family OmpA-OmpF porin
MNVLRRTTRFLTAVALCLSVLSPAGAAELQPWEVGVGLGFIDPGNKRDIDTDVAGLLTLGYRFDPNWGAEAFGMLGNDINLWGGRGLYHFGDFSGWTPYVSAGLGFTDPSPGRTDTTLLAGVGVKRPINENLGFRAELNAHQGLDSGATDLSMFFGVTWSWGASPAPRATPVAAPVASPPLDADGDGVPDSRDNCPNTPQGVKVDSHGCPLDSDGDGVPDNLDNCPNTAKGTAVDIHGCALDSDGDGVPDSQDDCPNTPKGTKVDAHGCPLVDNTDSDGDGVPDRLDKCANTPSGAKVDTDGCPQKLLEKVGIRLELNFDTNKADIKPDFRDEIGRVATFMRQYPGTTVVIEGHTDNTGTTDYNQDLSERRAKAVAQSLIHDHGVAANRVQAVGYGETKPIASNDTAAGRAENRRVTAAIEETVNKQ